MSQALNPNLLPVRQLSPEFFEEQIRTDAQKAKGHLANIKRNEKCPCGSNVKFKKCCMAYLQKIARA